MNGASAKAHLTWRQPFIPQNGLAPLTKSWTPLAQKRLFLTRMRTLLIEKDVSDGKEGAYHTKIVSLAQMMATTAQPRSSVADRRMSLTNGRANEAKEGTTFAEKKVSDVE